MACKTLLSLHSWAPVFLQSAQDIAEHMIKPLKFNFWLEFNISKIKMSLLILFSLCLGHSLVQFSSVTQSCPTLCDSMNRSTPGLPVHHQHLEFTQTHIHRVRDAIQPSHPRSSPSLPALNLSQHQGLFQWVSSSHQVTKVLESLVHIKWPKY